MEYTEPSNRDPVQRSNALATAQGRGEAQELINALRTGAARREALRWALQAIYRTGDRVRLRAFTLEIQRALQEGQRRASGVSELRRFTDCCARLAASGAHLHRTDPADGPVTYFIALRGNIRPYIDLADVETALSSIEVRQQSARRRSDARRASATPKRP